MKIRNSLTPPYNPQSGKQTFKIIPVEQIRFLKGATILEKTAQRLWRLGIVIAKTDAIKIKGKDFYVLLYKGEKIVEGRLKQVNDFVNKKLFTHARKDKAILDYLEDVLSEIKAINLLKKSEDYLKYFDELKSGIVSRAFAKLLTLEEEAVLRFYTTNKGYKNFNKALRGEVKMTEFFRAQETLMNQALDKLPNYKQSGLLYRIENLSEEEIKSIYKIGDTITNKHFTSSTYDSYAIAGAMEKRNYTILIRIEGKNGKLIESLSTFGKEKEVIFKSKTKFKVIDIRETNNPIDFASRIETVILKEI